MSSQPQKNFRYLQNQNCWHFIEVLTWLALNVDFLSMCSHITFGSNLISCTIDRSVRKCKQQVLNVSRLVFCWNIVIEISSVPRTAESHCLLQNQPSHSTSQECRLASLQLSQTIFPHTCTWQWWKELALLCNFSFSRSFRIHSYRYINILYFKLLENGGHLMTQIFWLRKWITFVSTIHACSLVE